jgi:hypothetical protein
MHPIYQSPFFPMLLNGLPYGVFCKTTVIFVQLVPLVNTEERNDFLGLRCVKDERIGEIGLI